MEKVLVTGSNGFIGGYIASYLQEQGCFVIGLGRQDNPKNNVDKYIQMDLENPKFDRIDLDVDYVVHCAANMNHEKNPESIIKVNCIGTQKLLEYAVSKKVKAYVQISSLPLIGKPVQLPITEEHPVNPPTLYHITKRTEELLANHIHEMYGLRTVSFRISAPWGVGMNMNTILPVFVKNTVYNKDILLYGKGTRVQNFIHVEDIAKGVYLALKSNAQGIYNLCSENEFSNIDLANEIIKILKSNTKILFTDCEDVFDDYYFKVSTERASNDFNFKAKKKFSEGIEELASSIKNGGGNFE